jgi:small subunit ribosomal protein S8
MTDPISDMLTRIRNAVGARHARTDIPYSGMKLAMAGILKEEGFIADVATIEKGGFKWLRVTLRYDADGNPFESGIERISKPGKRVYSRHEEIPAMMGGLGVTIISTPRGLMTGRKARKTRIGGEIVCSVW